MTTKFFKKERKEQAQKGIGLVVKWNNREQGKSRYSGTPRAERGKRFSVPIRENLSLI